MLLISSEGWQDWFKDGYGIIIVLLIYYVAYFMLIVRLFSYYI